MLRSNRHLIDFYPQPVRRQPTVERMLVTGEQFKTRVEPHPHLLPNPVGLGRKLVTGR